MLEFITRFFRREEASKNLAKERLRLVLMSDRVSLAPDTFDAMKVEMLRVVRRYLDIDERSMDVHFENAQRQFLLLANIPVLRVRTPAQIAALAESNGHPPAAAVVTTRAGRAQSAATQTAQRPRRRRRRRTSAQPRLDSEPKREEQPPDSPIQ